MSGYQDRLKNVAKSGYETATVNPDTGGGREGYFSWDKHHTPGNVDEAVGVILPPYATYMDERIAAMMNKQPFAVPFMFMRGLHVIGPRQGKNNKFYCGCSKTLVNDNPPGIVPKSIVDAGGKCPICDACWTDIWPLVVKHKPASKEIPESIEYKQWKECHKQLCPQQKKVFNWLPQGSTTPVIFDGAQTIGDAIQQIHYDPKQPDLLFPVNNPPLWTSAWVQITRIKTEHKTEYKVNTVYVGQYPHIINTENGFNEELYLQILSRVPDLRKLCSTDDMNPTPDILAKAMAKVEEVKRNFGFNVAASHSVSMAVNTATAGVAGGVATSAPPMTVPTANGGVIAPPLPGPPVPGVVAPTQPQTVPQMPASFLPPGMMVPTIPMQPASITPDSTQAAEMLKQMLNPPPA